MSRPRNPPPRLRRISDNEIQHIVFALGYEGGVAQTKSQRVAIAFLFAIETAMRADELCGIQRGIHTDRQGVSYVKRPTVVHLALTKNGFARDVPLSPRAVEFLGCLPLTGAALFGLDTSALEALFRKGRDRAGVEDLHFHDTLHEAISRLAKMYRPGAHRRPSQLESAAHLLPPGHRGAGRQAEVSPLCSKTGYDPYV